MALSGVPESNALDRAAGAAVRFLPVTLGRGHGGADANEEAGAEDPLRGSSRSTPGLMCTQKNSVIYGSSADGLILMDRGALSQRCYLMAMGHHLYAQDVNLGEI